VREVTDSRELPFFIHSLTADHLSQDGKAVTGIVKITIADTEQLSGSWVKAQTLDGLNGTDIDFIDPSTNEGESGIVVVH
jgi:hypothetical protein